VAFYFGCTRNIKRRDLAKVNARTALNDVAEAKSKDIMRTDA
jgi:hypothetical protein